MEPSDDHMQDNQTITYLVKQAKQRNRQLITSYLSIINILNIILYLREFWSVQNWYFLKKYNDVTQRTIPFLPGKYIHIFNIILPEDKIHFDSFPCFDALSENIICSASILLFSIIWHVNIMLNANPASCIHRMQYSTINVSSHSHIQKSRN